MKKIMCLLMDDVHIEHRTTESSDKFLLEINDRISFYKNYDYVVLVVLAGDIGEGINGLNWAKKIKAEVLYVPGNHEFWKNDYYELISLLRSESKNSNVYFLYNSAITLYGIRFIGTTLWTSFGSDVVEWKSRNPVEKRSYLLVNDFYKITANGWYDNKINRDRLATFFENDLNQLEVVSRNKWWNPLIQKDENNKATQFLKKELWLGGDSNYTVVISHHSPLLKGMIKDGMNKNIFSPNKLSDSYYDECISGEVHGNNNIIYAYSYSNNLTYLFGYDEINSRYKKIDYWFHGHIHNEMHYFAGPSLISSSPTGYRWQSKSLKFKEIEIKPNIIYLVDSLLNKLKFIDSFVDFINEKRSIFVSLVKVKNKSKLDLKLLSSLINSLLVDIEIELDKTNDLIRNLLLEIVEYLHPYLELDKLEDEEIFKYSKLYLLDMPNKTYPDNWNILKISNESFFTVAKYKEFLKIGSEKDEFFNFAYEHNLEWFDKIDKVSEMIANMKLILAKHLINLKNSTY